MALSSELISEFVKVTNDSIQNEQKEITVYGRVTSSSETIFVMFDGATSPTPVTAAVPCSEGDRVSVLLKDHTAIVTNNFTSPPINNSTINEAVSSIVANEAFISNLNVANGYIEQLTAFTGKFNSLDVEVENISNLIADIATANQITASDIDAINASIEALYAAEADIESLSVDDFNANNADLAVAAIDNLVSYFAKFTSARANILEAYTFSANTASINNLDAYTADIDILSAASVLSKSGIIANMIVDNQTITGELVGVTIRGNQIIANTLSADKLILKGKDGLFYQINAENLITNELHIVDYISNEWVDTNEILKFDVSDSEPFIENDSEVYIDDTYQVFSGTYENLVYYIEYSENEFHIAKQIHSLDESEDYWTDTETIVDFDIHNSELVTEDNNQVYVYVDETPYPLYSGNYTSSIKYIHYTNNIIESSNNPEAYENGVDGSILISKSVTAEKIFVEDLSAFEASIGGFKLNSDSIHSFLRPTVSSDGSGVYLDKDGQVSFGDLNQYIKFIKVYDQNGQTDEFGNPIEFEWKLMIKADELDIGSENLKVFMSTLSSAISYENDSLSLKGVNGFAISFDVTKGIVFSRDGTDFGTWDGISFHTGDIVIGVNEKAQFGAYAWLPRSDTSLGLLRID